ncbi:hypothetical protein EMQ25_05855 [Arsenicitalea aurantiaca]|uniref:Uncharacterized protein n=1 Tax=Arsenicitalea aurantiaca TaxID=1783274 RepID=A0A433XFE3_9HYPH|nr:hypothetical protein [Arsenicitalea aurantiaca]RUT32668.1 hypothetical protein EMQ25_05855 [Arsenicitalea aurantiaca]
MFKLLWRLISLAAVLVLVAYLVGWRVFVVPPVAPLSEGGIFVVTDMPQLQLLDSPSGFCAREGQANLVCAAAIATRVSQADIAWRLPYNGFLYSLAGGR